MSVTVRPAREEDLDAMAVIEASRPSAPGWKRAQFAEELGRPDRLLLVAEVEGKPVGHVAAWLVGDEAQLFTIVVGAQAERQGVGRALLNEVKHRAREAGFRRVALEVSEQNAAARALYERCGGRIVGKRPRFYPDGSDALLMDLPL
ncbi:MAG: ribosomal protein S18-alanine N-acetyltransferase [Elusimicrobia bacterium]|nr:ribosomal protein S18-alanine N-acetyltransferase [Elusimicrobiota bacterium]